MTLQPAELTRTKDRTRLDTYFKRIATRPPKECPSRSIAQALFIHVPENAICVLIGIPVAIR